ncbi:uncharacterized protein LOC133362834 [Lethenteron reissneri]|uniref:uncharacterized protein LOC133362834 n=1 Tax=Lethenteron reissneri TaxID=7753 RepID=UPI002AB7CC98|nr:uncharacterized protein LOC133362834 [Lethenteron reissneri]
MSRLAPRVHTVEFRSRQAPGETWRTPSPGTRESVGSSATSAFRNYRSLSVTGERYHVFENGTLRILDLRREDADTYTCFATNNLGSSQLCAHLHVPVASDGEDRGQDGSGYEEEDDEQETTAPDASSSRDGGADEDDDEDDDDEDDDEEDDEEDEVSATSPAAAAASSTAPAGRATATSSGAPRRLAAAATWATALLLALAPRVARAAWRHV